MCKYLGKFWYDMLKPILPMRDLTKDILNSCGQTSTKRIYLTQPRISLHERLNYATTMDASEGANGGCYKTIGLSVSHRTHWTTPKRNALKMKSVSQSSLACICGTSTFMEYTTSQYIQIINRSRQFSRSLHSKAPRRLQRMILMLQEYRFSVR